MSDRLPARWQPPTHRQLLDRVLDQRELVTAIQHLPAPVLARLIDHVGLEDAGELISLATTDQLEQVFDQDLWRSRRPGEDEAFDAARFAVWLEVMLEAGAAGTARRLAEMSEDLVVHALHQRALVLDLDALAVEVDALGDDGDVVEKLLEDRPYLELDTFRVVARQHEGWDALVEVLVALDEQHHDFLVRVLGRCCYLAAQEVEDKGGLHDVLGEDETLAADVAAAREDRRARDGFIAPSSAAAFLRLAATTDAEAARRQGRDPITRAYFRELAPRPVEPLAAPAQDLIALLRASGALSDDRVLPRLSSGAGSPDEASFRGAMQALRDRAPQLHDRRMTELVYLVNVLVAGKGLRPEAAAQTAIEAVSRGLRRLVDLDGVAAEDVLEREGADLLFRLGWRPS